ncbi:protein kinase, ATP binding site-containing protein [Tanacetum coccineum]
MLATGNFSEENQILKQGDCVIYRGQLSEGWKNCMAAFRHYRGDGDEERKAFQNELNLISSLKHDNIIAFIGYCDEGVRNMVIVYEYPVNDLPAESTPTDLIELVQHYYDSGLDKFIDPAIKDQTGGRSFHMFNTIAFKCISLNLKDRPTMATIVQTFEEILHINDWWRGFGRSLQRRQLSELLDKPRNCIQYDLIPRNEMILVYEYARNGSLDYHLQKKKKRQHLTWVFFKNASTPPFAPPQGADSTKDSATSPLTAVSWGEDLTSVPRQLTEMYSLRVGQILLDGNMEAKICDFGLSKSKLTSNQQHSKLYTNAAGTNFYIVLVYQWNVVSLQRCLMMYSFGVVLFEMDSGDASITTIQSHQYRRPEDLLIPLEEIKAACDFSITSRIGDGGFATVYKGRLSEHWHDHEVAIKRHRKASYQEKNEFRNELELNCRFYHENIIHFVGYCDEGNEMILVYEYANNGSLDYLLEDKNKRRCLTWVERLKICLGAAKGLDYLHTGLGEDNKVIHRDFKSGNILLDDNLEAKICDFGLSKLNSADNEHQSKVYTNAAGTNFYMDPLYHESGILRTDSDVYSFGVVMFELLSGLVAYNRRRIGDGELRRLINLVRRYYDYGKELLIDPEIKDKIDNSSFQTFIETAYQCISFNSRERPTMEMVAEKIEEALEFQVSLDQSYYLYGFLVSP